MDVHIHDVPLEVNKHQTFPGVSCKPEFLDVLGVQSATCLGRPAPRGANTSASCYNAINGLEWFQILNQKRIISRYFESLWYWIDVTMETWKFAHGSCSGG